MQCEYMFPDLEFEIEELHKEIGELEAEKRTVNKKDKIAIQNAIRSNLFCIKELNKRIEVETGDYE